MREGHLAMAESVCATRAGNACWAHVFTAGESQIALGRLCTPHGQRIVDVVRRLKRTADIRYSVECTLDWLSDGVVLVRADGAVLYANAAFETITRRDDGIGLRKGVIEFNAAEARTKFNAAVAAASRLKGGDLIGAQIDVFTAPRPIGNPPYLVFVCPLIHARGQRPPPEAVAAVFVRDRIAPGSATVGTLREVFGLTEAEAALAQALQLGVTLTDYARARTLSRNTVYTHLRRLREKTGSSRMAELILKLNDLRLPLRLD